MPVKRIFATVVLVCLSAVLTTVSGQSSRIVFTPQWTPQSQFAGYYAAKAKGFYREAGLDVVISHPSASNPALNRLVDGSCHVITMQLMQALETIDSGTALVNILQTSQRNSLMIIPRNPGIRTTEDLKGKKIGIWKAGFGELARIFDRENGLEVEWIPFVNSINLFISGAIDATLAMSYNEYLQILACGFQPGEVFYFSDLGYDIPEDGLYVTADYYAKHKDVLEAFAEASARGWLWAAGHPEEALDIVMEQVRLNNVGTNRVIQGRMLENILQLQCPEGSDAPSFVLDTSKLEQASALMFREGYISRIITYGEITGAQL